MATSKKTTKKEVTEAGAKPALHTTLDRVVMKAAMQKTVVVKVTRFEKHPKYQKYMTISKKYKVHDEAGTAKVGDKVTIVETKPISKDKHFTLVQKA